MIHAIDLSAQETGCEALELVGGIGHAEAKRAVIARSSIAAPILQHFHNDCCRRLGGIDDLQVFRRDGTFVKEFVQLKDTRGPGSVWDLYLLPDRAQTYFVTADGENNEVRVVRREDGAVVGTFGRSGRNAGFFHWVHNIAVDSQGNVFTAEVDNAKRIQKFRPVNGAPEK